LEIFEIFEILRFSANIGASFFVAKTAHLFDVIRISKFFLSEFGACLLKRISSFQKKMRCFRSQRIFVLTCADFAEKTCAEFAEISNFQFSQISEKKGKKMRRFGEGEFGASFCDFPKKF